VKCPRGKVKKTLGKKGGENRGGNVFAKDKIQHKIHETVQQVRIPRRKKQVGE